MNIYSYHIIDWFEQNRGNNLIMGPKSSPDLSFVYDVKEFNQVSYRGLSIPSTEKTLIFSAFYLPTSEEARNGMSSFPRRLCLDFVNIELQQIKWEKRLVIDIDAPPTEFLTFLPVRRFTKDKILFQRTCYENNVMKMKMLEYDYTGKFLYSYTIEYPDSWENLFECIKKSNLVLLFPEETKLEDLEIRVIKLDKGKTELVKEIKGIVSTNGEGEMGKDYYIQNLVRKLDHLLVPVESEGKVEDVFHSEYMTIDLISKQVVHKVVSYNKACQTYSLNWNSEEIGITYTVEDSDSTLFFKMERNAIVEGKDKMASLKHLARLAVLTSFSYNQLMEFNLPLSLFDYLGIEK